MSVPLHTSSIYSLTWGDYGTSLVSAVQLLRMHGDLVDVTLAAGGRSFPAHKIVLCAASPFLLDLLKVRIHTCVAISSKILREKKGFFLPKKFIYFFCHMHTY